MENRVAIPPGLPLPNPTTSYWQHPPSPLASYRSTNDLPCSTDVVIIGSGITGTLLAHNLLDQPSPPSIVMLEARTACSGATGRNGGHTKCASYRSFLGNLASSGEAEAAKIARFEYNSMKAVHAFARDHGIDCDSWEGETVDVFFDEAEWEKAKKAVAEMERILGEHDPASAYEWWDWQEAEKKFLTPGAVGALTYEAGSLSAYKFVVGLLGLLVDRGLNLQTETPAMSIEQCGSSGGLRRKWLVETTRASIAVDKVILATNGYTAHLYPALEGVIVPLRGHVTAHRPGDRMPNEGLNYTYSFIYHGGYEYMISRRPQSKFAGDIIIGGGLTKAAERGLYEFGTTDDTTMDPVIISYLRNSTTQYFDRNWGHDHQDGKVRREWSGIMGYSADGFPLIGQIPDKDGLYIAASFQGHGMVLCFSSATALATMMAGGDEEELYQWFPKAFCMAAERYKHKFKY
ncbi:FAD dependent oxidoreductase [Lasallia pustulata]|uniref:FAD dependent oxidoreductase n=1 Tax=Lasallia pustulata TaxID=136370 RepID=A0A1W5CX98_9LECA|nr:FAD dependent oxidoreductase [Lasallia pustulata]